ncbi:MAG: BF3164 family lipoprotein [Bacteroidales bacterium]|nr:BF3164 family lipoprotein [Bacteroidales bacterium]
MRNGSLLFIALLSLIFTSCHQEKNELPDFKNAQLLAVVDSIDIESLGILNPHIIRYYNDVLVFNTATGEEEMHFLDLHDLSVIEKKVIGPGPNQVSSDYEFVASPSKNTFYYRDVNKLDVYSFNIDSLRENPAMEQKWLYQIPKKKGVAFVIMPLDIGRYVYYTGLYTSGENWIYCYDKQTQEFRAFGNFPQYAGTEDLELLTKSSLFAGMGKATNGKRLTLCHFGTLDFYDITEDGGLRMFREHHYFLPEIELYPNGSFRYKGESSKWGFSSCIASDEGNIYLLYSDKLINDNREQNAEYLFIYDWNGDPVKQYALEKPLYDLAVDGTSLYGLSREKEPIVYIYDLKDLQKEK